MKVKELIKLLEKEDENRIVIMSSDGEGNSFSPLCDISTGAYLADSSYSGEVGLEKLTPEAIKDGYTEEDVIKGEKALILYPTN